ncbi:hypothetical protein QJS10_CPB22g00883 [Acorus calamus]|uniref:Endonuclease/exonuclease/phosphatase domain-containing protein n=1 Tax=Acorus calamus TaxID=4465 RepID=A0AAV9C099_ACOCL|nr:hypothetical protein QJS10_CPB22g00883 [Acorus calamus]
MVVHLPQRDPYLVVGVYASPHAELRQHLWTETTEVLNTGLPTLIAGDFNSLLGPTDKRGGYPFRLTQDVLLFRQWKDMNGLCPLIAKGPKFTWCNNRQGNARTWELLDQAFANATWINQFPTTTVEVLPRSFSDHAPLLLTTEVSPPMGRKPFRFERFWFAYPDLYDIVTYNWRIWSQASPMGRLHNKLRRLQEPLRRWNRQVVGDLPKRVAQAHDQIQFLVHRDQGETLGMVDKNVLDEAMSNLASFQEQLETF